MNGSPSVKVALFIRNGGSESPCRWFYVTGIYSYITIIKEKRTALSRKRIPLNQNGYTANFRIGVPFEQNLHIMNLPIIFQHFLNILNIFRLIISK